MAIKEWRRKRRYSFLGLKTPWTLRNSQSLSPISTSLENVDTAPKRCKRPPNSTQKLRSGIQSLKIEEKHWTSNAVMFKHYSGDHSEGCGARALHSFLLEKAMIIPASELRDIRDMLAYERDMESQHQTWVEKLYGRTEDVIDEDVNDDVLPF